MFVGLPFFAQTCKFLVKHDDWNYGSKMEQLISFLVLES